MNSVYKLSLVKIFAAWTTTTSSATTNVCIKNEAGAMLLQVEVALDWVNIFIPLAVGLG